MRSGGLEMMSSSAIVAFNLKEGKNWWWDVNESPVWQDRIFHVLAVLYGIVSVIAVIQLVRIQLRVPEYGWTTQKVFHFLNFMVNGVRALVFLFRRDAQNMQPEILQHILLDIPSLAFFTTYALLVLFWAEIYYQARAVSTDGLRPSFFTINAVVYVIQVKLTTYLAFVISEKFSKFRVNLELGGPVGLSFLLNFLTIHLCCGFLSFNLSFECINFRLLFGWFCGGSLFTLW
jgi:hypothetical protein